MSLHVVDTDTGEVVDRQVMPDLDTETRAALRESILRFGVMVPIVVDQDSRIIDGHNRWAIADELNVDCPSVAVTVESEADALAIAADLNLQRRHMPPAARRSLAQSLRERGHSMRAIAGALNVHHSTVAGDLGQPDMEVSDDPTPPSEPDRVTGQDGKSYPSKRRVAWSAEELLSLLDRSESEDRDAIAADIGTSRDNLDHLLVKARKIRKGETTIGKLNRLSETVRAEQIAELAEQNYTSRQIGSKLDIGDQQVRRLAQRNGIDITADKVTGKARHHDSNRITGELVNTLEAHTISLGLIDMEALDPTQIAGWVTSISDSLRALTRFRNQLKEMTRD